jgi:competence protein ComFC
MPLSDVLFPKQCFNCQAEGKYLCDKCSLFLTELPDIAISGFESVTSCWEHNGILKKIMREAKSNGIFDALRELTDRAISARETCLPEDLSITFVPSEKREEKLRGFNPARIIAEELGKAVGRRVISLLETRAKKKQDGLDKRKRFQNVRNCFSIKKGVVLPEKAILVDDVLASGATMAECCRVLKENGVKKVWGFTISREN